MVAFPIADCSAGDLVQLRSRVGRHLGLVTEYSTLELKGTAFPTLGYDNVVASFICALFGAPSSPRIAG